MKRLITAAIIIPLLYLYITRLPEGYFFGLMACTTLLGLYEYYRMFKLKKDLTVLSIFSGLLIFYLSYKEIVNASGLFQYSALPSVLALSFIIIASWRMLSVRNPAGSLRDTSLAISGIVYVVVLASFQLRLRHIGPEWILFLYGTIWLSDSSAYYIGTHLGRRKLYPQLSPNKTVEGAIGSIIGGIAGSYILSILFLRPSHPIFVLSRNLSGTDILILGIIIGVGCIIGDLVESMFKRDAGVKDSSNLIPGHGGILDKIDSSLVVAPFVYFYLKELSLL